MSDTSKSPLRQKAESKLAGLLESNKKNYKSFKEEYSEEVAFIENVELFLCWANCILGVVPPEDEHDSSMRDLIADVFDSFLAAKKLILEGFLNQPFPLLRRAYEGMLLIRYLIQYPEKEVVWREGGKKGRITPEQTRDCPIGDKDFLGKLYDYYCTGTHMNSKYIWMRQLGTKNKFTLGTEKAEVHSLITKEYIMRHIQLISLFRYIVHCRYVPILEGVDASIANYMDCISDERATELNEKLNEKLIALKREAGIKIGIEV